MRFRHCSGHPFLRSNLLALCVIASSSGIAAWKDAGNRQSHVQHRRLSHEQVASWAQHTGDDFRVGIVSRGLMRREHRTPLGAGQPYPVLPRELDPCGDKRPCRGFAGCIGSPDKLKQGMATIKSLRATGNRDPVQIFHVDGELQVDAIEALESLPGVRVHDLKDVLGPRWDIQKYRGYACSSMSLLASSFEHVMVIGGDGIFFSDPAQLWESELLHKTGALFVRDRLALNEHGYELCSWLRKTALPWFEKTAPWLNATLDRMYETRRQDVCLYGSKHVQCSNQVFLDKTRADILHVLAIIYKLQEDFVKFAPEFVAKRSTSPGPFNGEKELYWMACELAGAACVDSFMEKDAMTIASAADIHKSPAGEDLMCGVTAHYLNDTSTLLSANLASKSVEDLEFISLMSPRSALCGRMKPDMNRLCCSAPAGMRRLTRQERDVLLQWARENPVQTKKGGGLADSSGPVTGKHKKVRKPAHASEDEAYHAVVDLRDVDANRKNTFPIPKYSLKTLELQLAQDPCRGHKPCRGFAGCVGAGFEWPMAHATIISLRATGNTDPVQIFHVDHELPLTGIQALEGLPNVSVHDFLDVLGDRPDLHKYRSYACSAMALLVSSFEHVMVIGGDGIFFSDPAKLWSSERMQRTGALFVHDRWVTRNGGMKLCKWMVKTGLPWLKRFAPGLYPSLDKTWMARHPAVCDWDIGTIDEQCSNQVFLDKSRKDIRRMLEIYYILLEEFFRFPEPFGNYSKEQPAPFHGEKDLYWISCEFAQAACVDSFMEFGSAVLSNHVAERNGKNVYCGNTAHFVEGSDELLSANLDGAVRSDDFKLVTLQSNVRGKCGLFGTIRCCEAPAGTRLLRPGEIGVLQQWSQNCKAKNVGRDCFLTVPPEHGSNLETSPGVPSVVNLSHALPSKPRLLIEDGLQKELVFVSEAKLTRGFIGCVENHASYKRAQISIRTLRATGNMDPIWVLYLEHRVPEIDLQALQSFPQVSVQAFEGTLGKSPEHLFPNLGANRGTACRSMAMLLAPFDQVAELDGDGIWFTDPAHVWESERFRHTGAFFVQDMNLDVARTLSINQWVQEAAVPWLASQAPELGVRDEPQAVRHKAECLGGGSCDQSAGLIFLDKSRDDIRRVLAIYRRLLEDFVFNTSLAFNSQDFIGSLPEKKIRRTVFINSWNYADLYWVACELAMAPCTGSFSLHSHGMLVTEISEMIHNHTEVWCGGLAHTIDGTDVVLSGRLPENRSVSQVKFFMLPAGERPYCAVADGDKHRCCSAPAGLRALDRNEVKFLQCWNLNRIDLNCTADMKPFPLDLTLASNRPLPDLTSETKRSSGTLSAQTRSPSSAQEHVSYHERAHHHRWHCRAQNFQRSILLVIAIPSVIMPLVRFSNLPYKSVWVVALFYTTSAFSLVFVAAAATVISPATSVLLLLQFLAAAVLSPERGGVRTCGLEVWPIVMRNVRKTESSVSAIDVALPVLRMLLQMEVLKRLPLQIVACALSVAPVLTSILNHVASDPSGLGCSCSPIVATLSMLASVTFIVKYAVRQLALETSAYSDQSLLFLGFWFSLLLADARAPHMKCAKQNSSFTLQATLMALCVLGLLAWTEGSLEWEVLRSLRNLEWLLMLLACMIGPLLQHVSRLLDETAFLMWKDSVRIGSLGPALAAHAILWDLQVSTGSALLLLGCFLCSAMGSAPILNMPASSSGRGVSNTHEAFQT